MIIGDASSRYDQEESSLQNIKFNRTQFYSVKYGQH